MPRGLYRHHVVDLALENPVSSTSSGCGLNASVTELKRNQLALNSRRPAREDSRAIKRSMMASARDLASTPDTDGTRRDRPFALDGDANVAVTFL